MVNLRAAERQALGAHFVAKPGDEEVVAKLCGGELTLPPHKKWQLPEEPTWTEDPFSDNNWQFQYHMLRWLDPLRRAGRNGNAQAAETWERYARSWIESNPPGNSKSRWAWIDMTDGIRAMELCHGLCVVGEQDWLVRSLEQHRDWLSDPAHIKHGNHGLHQTLGLFVVSAVLEDQSGLDLAVDWLGGRLRDAWDEQGVNEEGSLAYHRMNYLWWQEAMTRLDLEGIDRPEGAQRLHLAPEEMAHATSPLGRLARIGDTNAASIRDIDHPYADFVTSGGTRGASPAKTTAIYDRGYAYIRSGWGQDRPFVEETYLTAVFGPQDKVHGHVDGGSLTYCSQGVQWLHDAGRYYYGRHAMQDYMKSRAAHSLVVLPERTPDKSRAVDLIHSQVTEDFTDLLLSDNCYDGVSITRRVVYLKHWDLTVVLDHVDAEGPVQAEQRWHCGRDISATALSIGFSLAHQDKTFHVAALTTNTKRDVRRGQEKPLLGWTATGWRRSTPVDVGTVYDAGQHLVFGAVLGTWCPPAVDLLTERVEGLSGINGPVTTLIPDALLAPPWTEASKRPVRRRPAKLELTARLIAGNVVTAIAHGPGRYFKFDLIDDDGVVKSGSWRASREFAFELGEFTTVRLLVSNRNDLTDVQKREILISSKNTINMNHTPINELPAGDIRNSILGQLTDIELDNPETLSNRNFSKESRAQRSVELHTDSADHIVAVQDTLWHTEESKAKAYFAIPSHMNCLLRGSGAEIFSRGEKQVELTWTSTKPVSVTLESSQSDSSSTEQQFISFSVDKGDAKLFTQLRTERFFYRDWGVRPGSGDWKQYLDEVPVNFLLDEVPGASDLAIVFSALGPEGSFTYNYKNTLDDLPVHKMYILDDFGEQGSYFYSETKNLRIYRSVLNAVRATMDSLGVPAQRVHMLGTSKGGSAALIFGSSLEVASIIIGAPQIKIGHFLSTPHPNILKFMTGGTDEDSINWADRIITNHLGRLSDDTSLEVIIGDADHHFVHHHPVLKSLLKENGHQDFHEVIVSGADHKSIGRAYRKMMPPRLMHKLGQSQVFHTTFEGWRLSIFVRGDDLLAHLESPSDGSAATVYVYAQSRVQEKHAYASENRWIPYRLRENVRIRFYVRRNGEVKATSTPTVHVPRSSSVHGSGLLEATKALVPSHKGSAAEKRGLKILQDGVMSHPNLGEIRFDKSMLWQGITGRTDQRFVHGFLYLADWHDSVLPQTPSAAALTAQFFVRWASTHPIPTTPSALKNSGMAFHDETTAQRGLHLARFCLENWQRLNNHERCDLEQLMRNMIQLLSTEWFHGGNNNHGMFQDCALLLLASVGQKLALLTDQETQESAELASQRLLRYFKSSFSTEGIHLENSPGYHLMASRYLRDVTPLVSQASSGAGRELQSIYAAAERYAIHAIMPNGMVPPLSDTKQFDVGRSNHASTFTSDQYMWSASRGKRGLQPDQRSAVFPEAGYAVHRSSWSKDADWLLFTSGYKAQFHHHADDLSLLFFRDGGLVLSEAGPYGYDYSDPKTQYAFSQWAHNTIVVDGISLPRVDASPGGVTLQDTGSTRQAPSNPAISVKGICSRNPNWIHTRDLVVHDTGTADRLRAEVSDRVEGTDQSLHSFECLWHAGPGISIEVVGSSAIFSREGRSVLTMRWETSSSVEASVKSGSDPQHPRTLRFPTFGVHEEGIVLSLKACALSLELTTWIE